MKGMFQIQITIILIFCAPACNNDHEKQSNMETHVKSAATNTTMAISKDGTAIAYEKTGNGPVIIVVNGALSHRKLYDGKELAGLLGKNFTLIFYDRRGRGESTDTKPYTAQKEIEDIEALINENGGSAYLFGTSSGAALSLLAAEKLGPGKVTKLALYEMPYGAVNQQEYVTEKNTINELVGKGDTSGAVSFFMEKRAGAEQLEAMKNSPQWNNMVSIGHTLVYDFEVLGDGTVPIGHAKKITIPTLVMAGEKSPDPMHATADTVTKVIPGAIRKTIKGQDHNAKPEAVAPVLQEFFM